MELIVNLSGLLLSVFADIGLRNISLIMWKLGKLIVELMRKKESVNVSCLSIFQYLVPKISNASVNTHVTNMIQMVTESAKNPAAKAVPGSQASITATVAKHTICITLYSKQEKKEKPREDQSTLNGCKIKI